MEVSSSLCGIPCMTVTWWYKTYILEIIRWSFHKCLIISEAQCLFLHLQWLFHSCVVMFAFWDFHWHSYLFEVSHVIYLSDNAQNCLITSWSKYSCVSSLMMPLLCIYWTELTVTSWWPFPTMHCAKCAQVISRNIFTRFL